MGDGWLVTFDLKVCCIILQQGDTYNKTQRGFEELRNNNYV